MMKLNLQVPSEPIADLRSETDAIRTALREAVQELARFLCGDPNRRMSNRLEWRFGSHGSLSIVVAGPKAGNWFDHEAGRGGDAFDLISLRLGLGFCQAREWARQFVSDDLAHLPAIQPTTVPVAANSNYKELAERIWREAADPRGTVVQAYLASRKLPIPVEIAGAVIRFHGALMLEGGRGPGMVALMRDIRSNEPCGIHRTFLTPEGAKLEKKMLGRAKNAAIKLTPDEDVANGLHVGEGIETCLSWMQLGFTPTWALGSSGAIASFPVLSGIEALTIFKETDAASDAAASCCGQRWHASRREVWEIRPNIPGDGNDILKMAA